MCAMTYSNKMMPSLVACCLWLGTTMSMATTTDSTPSDGHNFYVPGVIDTVYSQLGDINIGASVMVTTASVTYPSGECAEGVKRPQFTLETVEAIKFTTDLINKNPDVLPNVTFGFVIRGSCTSMGVTLATSMSFLPHNQQDGNDSVCSSDHLQAFDSCPISDGVIGTMAQGWSSLTVPVSSLYSVAHLPIIGSTETSDELSNKNKHPYFFRTIPPDVYKVQAMLNFISANKWSYISVLYADGSFGQTAFDHISRLAEGYGICIATSHRLLFNTDYQAVVADLLVHSRARAVVLFLVNREFQAILQSVIDQNAIGHFIWIGSGSLDDYDGEKYKGATTDPGIGAFSFQVLIEDVPEFRTFVERQNVFTSTNPWMKSIWEYLFDCSFELGNCKNHTSLLESPKYQPLAYTPLRIDAVLTLAQAAHDLLSDRCPNARGKEARACISGKLMREYLKNTTFEGFQGRIQFDKNQELKSKYIISQLQYDDKKLNHTGTKRIAPTPIGFYDILNDKTEFYDNSISWSHLNTLDRIFPWLDTEDSLPIEVPESVCSGPCSVGEYKIEKEVPCCWKCRRCRDNERLVEGNTSCQVCPSLTWPDPSSGFTTCIEIPPTYSTLSDTIPIVLLSLTIFALVIYLCTVVGYVFYRNERVIKASSRELSVIQLIAIAAGYANILLFQVKPTAILCNCVYFLFCLSFVLLYAPLLVKTVRIFRIFQSGKSNNRQLRFISPGSQVFISVFLIVLQIILCAATFVFFSPGIGRTQPISNEKLVELSCDFTLPGLASFLGYNIVLVSLCSVFAIKVRKLPDNFNESQFMAMCVTTTLLIWLAFIPTYFTASREYVRVFLLSTALLLNHSVALVFLFIPKIYAAAFVPQASGKAANGKP